MDLLNYEIVFHNTTSSILLFILEPWGNEVWVQCGSTIRFGFQGETVAAIPIAKEGNRIIVEGCHGVDSTGIWLDGEIVG